MTNATKINQLNRDLRIPCPVKRSRCTNMRLSKENAHLFFLSVGPSRRAIKETSLAEINHPEIWKYRGDYLNWVGTSGIMEPVRISWETARGQYFGFARCRCLHFGGTSQLDMWTRQNFCGLKIYRNIVMILSFFQEA